MSWSRDPAFRPEWAAADGMPFSEWCEVYHDSLWAEYHETGSCYETDWEVWLERAYERKGFSAASPIPYALEPRGASAAARWRVAGGKTASASRKPNIDKQQLLNMEKGNT